VCDVLDSRMFQLNTNLEIQSVCVVYVFQPNGLGIIGKYNTKVDISIKTLFFSVDKKNQLNVAFCILYFSSNSCSTCFGQPCVHHQELTTA